MQYYIQRATTNTSESGGGRENEARFAESRNCKKISNNLAKNYYIKAYGARCGSKRASQLNANRN